MGGGLIDDLGARGGPWSQFISTSDPVGPGFKPDNVTLSGGANQHAL